MYRLQLLFISLLWASPIVAQTTLSAELKATIQEHPTVAGAWVDCAALLRKSGVPAALRADSVIVRPGDGGEAAPVPSRVEAAGGVYRVYWQVSAATRSDEVGTMRSFRMEFGTQAAPQVTPRLSEGSIDNLVDNGGFERASAEGVPEGIPPAVLRRDFKWVEESGGHALAFNADPEGHGPQFTTPWIAIHPGEPYDYSFRYCARGAEAHPRYKLIAYGYVNYRDAEGKLLPRVSVFSTSLGDTGGWKELRTSLPTPAGARWANLEVRNGSKIPYSFLIDDVRIALATLPQILVAQSPDGRRISLRAEDQNLRRFDLGPVTSPVWEGFKALTPEMTYTTERGFGFTRLQQPVAADKVRPDALARDFITAQRADLRVDLADGEYNVWILTGDSQVGNTIIYIYRDQKFTVDGQEVFTRNPRPAEFFRTTYFQHYKDFWVPGMDYYDTFVAPHFEEHIYPATVTGGKLTLSWSNLPVAAIIIYPRSFEPDMKEELARLRADRKRATAVEEVPNPKETRAPATAEERKRGFVLFRRPDNESVYPTSRPAAEQRVQALQVFAAPGQSESTHFSLFPLRDLGAVQVRATDLRSGANRLPSSAIEVRVVRYIFAAEGTNGSSASYRYRIAPRFLDRRDSVPVTVGVTWSWWAIVHVPDDAPAGIYQGALEIAPQNGKPYSLALRVRVLPFRLAPLPITQGYYYFPDEPWYSTFWEANVVGTRYGDDPEMPKIIENNERQQMRFMKSLGLNSIAFSDDMRGDLVLQDGKVHFKPGDRFTWWMDIYRDEGMGPMPFYGFQPLGESNTLSWLDRARLKERFTPEWNTAYRSLVEEAQRVGKERGWPEILWYVSDELSNFGEPGGKLGVELAKALRGILGARTIASMNGPWEHPMAPYLSISMPNIAFPITEETVKMIRDAGSELWLYNCGDERLNLGLYPWRVKAGGRFQWHYHCMNADPWDDLDGSYADTAYCVALPGPDGPVPAMQAEVVREAVDDHRYVATLETAITAAKNDPKKSAVVAKAEQFLDDLRRRIPVDFRVLVGYQVDPRAAGSALGGEFKNTDNLDRVRWAMAQLIVELGGGR